MSDRSEFLRLESRVKLLESDLHTTNEALGTRTRQLEAERQTGKRLRDELDRSGRELARVVEDNRQLRGELCQLRVGSEALAQKATTLDCMVDRARSGQGGSGSGAGIDPNDLLVDTILDWVDRTNRAREDNCALRLEVDRLKDGNFTQEEFQNLCHRQDPYGVPGTTPPSFCIGCVGYWLKLFGEERAVRAFGALIKAGLLMVKQSDYSEPLMTSVQLADEDLANRVLTEYSRAIARRIIEGVAEYQISLSQAVSIESESK